MSNCQLYCITPPKIDLKSFTTQLEEAFSGGHIASLQLRLKDASDDEIIKAAQSLQPICARYDCAFILNDRPDLVQICKADGVHLGQEDLDVWSIEKTRKTIGEDAIIGVSAHASIHLGMEAGEQGADYIAFGAFYPTKTKSAEKLAKWGTPDPDILTWWSTYTVLPCVAIGGITPANCTPLVEAGADFIACVSAVWDHPEGPAKAVEEFNQAINK